ncbi:hypothetical protein GE09DRAFT_336665 [Coniochaeta sp. 2T2.1]|nr:hypothetical protein GE09DRAFT_336665 [Coniochaeta sp. 2T2.1]
MSLSPTIGISKLSIESMPPSTRSHGEMNPPEEDVHGKLQGEGDDSTDEYDNSTVRSPTRLKYNIERLSPHTRKMVRSLWGESFEEPPEISLQWCDRMLDADGNIDFYAFQMHEVVPRSVRIGSPKSQYAEPQCQCGAPKPCKHLIWLSDCIAQQALYDHDPQEPLTLNEQGYPEELGQPFRCISDMHLDVLADGLHCEVGHPLGRSGPSPQLFADAQSIIASITDKPQSDFNAPRSDLPWRTFDPASLVHHKDPEGTLFSLLLASHRLSAWIRSLLRSSDPARSPFQQIEFRARRVFTDLDTFLASTSPPGSSSPDTEGACGVPWAATSLTRCVRQIHTLIVRAEAPLSPPERASAARALVRILRGVVDRHDTDSSKSLYTWLIGDRDDSFIADSLELLVDQGQFIDEIEDILAHVGMRGAAASWVGKMEAVVVRMRANPRSTASSRGDRAPGPERVSQRRRQISPALGPVEHGAPGSASASGVGIGRSVGLGISYGPAPESSSSAGTSASGGGGVQFLTPQTAAAPPTRGRGGGRGSRGGSGGAGSKRSGAGTGSERGSKRAR